MSNFVIFKDDEYEVLINDIEIGEIKLDGNFCKVCRVGPHAIITKFNTKKPIQPKEQVFFLRNIIKAIDGGLVDFTDDKLYDFGFENQRAKDAGGVNNKFIDSDLKAEYKKEFDLYYQKMLDLINANYDFKLVGFMREMSRFFTMVSATSGFKEIPFDLREKFYEYLTDKFNL